MFYLSQFFKTILKSKILGLSFLIATIGFVSLSYNKNSIQKYVGKYKKVNHRPYFNALISKDLNLNSVARKIKSLPGVEKVNISKNIKASSILGSLSGELNSSIIDGLKSVNYSSLKVELSNNIKLRTQSLVQEYLSRLVGKEFLTVSDIKKVKSNKQKDSIASNIYKWADEYALIIIGFFWISCLILFLKKNQSYLYLIEKFQRRKNIKLKMMLAGITFLTFLTLSINILLNEYYSLLGISICLGIMILTVLVSSRHKEAI
ncbi:MAG: hypothetical protein N4A33_06385 [Bacteriovoracaceae bacterium]|jgi:hypothetical protein|nr:hypothetical protein [Bacteriovoracaceae bacterium]